MHFQFSLAVSALISAVVAINCDTHPFFYACGVTRMHVTNFRANANPNDNLPEVSFHVSAYHADQPYRSFGTTECKVGMHWGSQQPNHTLAGTGIHKCDNPKVKFAFGINWVLYKGTLYPEGYALQVSNDLYKKNGNAGYIGKDIMIKVFNPETVMTHGTGKDQYTYIDTPAEFKHSATYGPPSPDDD